MGVIERIKLKLAEYEGVQYSETPNGIEVYPTDDSGFTVGIFVSPQGYTVSFDGWHEDFESEDDALDCFAFGLSPNCRLCVMLRGGTPTKWTVESMQGGGRRIALPAPSYSRSGGNAMWCTARTD